MPEFDEWQHNTDDWQTWKLKYFKRFGTSTSKEDMEYFSDFHRHRFRYEYGSAHDDLAITVTFFLATLFSFGIFWNF
jgi:DNA topoisomerase-2